jgi:myosin heavy subunit
VLDVYAHPTKGVFALLDGLCMMGDRRGADRSMINKMAQLYPQITGNSPRSSGASSQSNGSFVTPQGRTEDDRSNLHNNARIVRVMQHEGLFQVRHQIADVKYSVAGLVMKNIDSVQHNMISLFTADGPSDNVFMFDVLHSTEAHGGGNPGGGGDSRHTDPQRARRMSSNSVSSAISDYNNPRSHTARMKKDLGTPGSTGRRQMARLRTVAQRFRGEINRLKKVLGPTQLRFVRCVKPNASKMPDRWEPALVLRQLRFLGVMNLVRIRNQGFPTRRTFAQMLAAYPELVSDAKVQWVKGKNDRGACKLLLKHAAAIGAVKEIAVGTNSKKNVQSATKVYVTVPDDEDEEDDVGDGDVTRVHPPGGEKLSEERTGDGIEEELDATWRLGTSKCFLKRHVLDAMDAAVREKRIKGAARQQYLERRRQARAMMEAERRAAHKLIPFMRMVPKRVQYLRRAKAAVRIQALTRAYLVRARFAELRAAQKVIARFAHRFLLMLAFKEYVKVQRVWSQVSAAVKVQSFVRMALVHLQVERAKYFLWRLQCLWRGFVVRRR